MSAVQNPKSIAEFVKLLAKHGKRAFLVSGVDPSSDKAAIGKVVIDLSGIQTLHDITLQKDKVSIGTGMNMGRLAREAVGENGLIRQAASIIANPLVRNKITFVQALDPESPYFDITTPLVLLDAKVRLQNPTGKRTMPIRDYLEAATKGMKKGEIPVSIEFTKLPSDERVGFFRVARMGGKGSVSAAARMKLVRNVCVDPEVVVSSLTLIPLRSKEAEKEIAKKVANEASIKKASELAADEILEQADSNSGYERTLIEITVARTLRSIMESSIPV
jgi:aerobic carbon-monoxide dehydrogenase medium subunit